MLLEIENELHRRIHKNLGQSAVVLRLAEEVDQSGRVAEQTMIVINYKGEGTNNPNKGAYIPTVRNRKITYIVTIIQKQVQREGHSFALPLIDLIYDAVTGWVPEVPGLEFQTGFEPTSSGFKELTEASQFIYQMNFDIEVVISDGRFFSQPCAAFDSISVGSFLPVRTCLLTPAGKKTGLAIWRRKVGVDTNEEYVVEDSRCNKEIADTLEVVCDEAFNGEASYTFIPRAAKTLDADGNPVIDSSLVTSGRLCKVWKCIKDNTGDYPDWFKLGVDIGLWRNAPSTVPNTDPDTAGRQDISVRTSKSYQDSE